MQYLSFSLWFISLSVVPSSSIHVVTNGRISLFLTAGPYSIVYVFHRRSHFFIHSSTDAHLGWFCSLVTVDNATTIMEEQIPLQDAVFISGMCLVTTVVVGAQIWWASISVSGGKARNGEDNPGEPGFFFFFFHWISWTSLAVQWIRIHLPMQETWVWSLVWDYPTCHRAAKPMCHSYWALAPQQEELLTAERSPRTISKSSPLLTEPRESLSNATMTQHSQTQIHILKTGFLFEKGRERDIAPLKTWVRFKSVAWLPVSSCPAAAVCPFLLTLPLPLCLVGLT